jgi:hypothetical protein
VRLLEASVDVVRRIQIAHDPAALDDLEASMTWRDVMVVFKYDVAVGAANIELSRVQ